VFAERQTALGLPVQVAKFRKLTDEWVALSLKIARAKKKVSS
jgi:hypothetical protein